MIRILVAEDSPTQALQVKSKLVDEGYEVLVASNGKEALEQIHGFKPHLILTDMQMPVLDGLELVTLSTAEYPSIPIVLITSKGSDQSAMEALERGAAAYLPKSQVDEKLFATIDEVLDLMESDTSYAELIGSMQYNEFRFTLDNKVELIRPLVELVQQMVAGVGLCDESGSIRVGMAVEHAMRNAMYHGNLELTTSQLDADSELVVEGEETLIQRRRSQSPYNERRLHVDIEITPQQLKVVIGDDGNGFDVSKMPVAADEDILDAEKGRGLVLIQSLMDRVDFNSAGNEITLVKERSPVSHLPSEQPAPV